MEEFCISFSLSNPLYPWFPPIKNFLLWASILLFFLQRVNEFFSLFSEALCDVNLIDLLENLISFSFGFEDISKFLFVPIFKMRFDVFKFLLEHKHFCTLNIQLLSPPFINVTSEFRVWERGIFKPEGYISRCAHEGGFQLYRPMIRSSKAKNGGFYGESYEKEVLWNNKSIKFGSNLRSLMRRRSSEIINLSSLEATWEALLFQVKVPLIVSVSTRPMFIMKF